MADGWRRERHYEKIGAHCGEMITKVKEPELNIMDCIWVTQVKWAGYPPENTTRLDQILASQDPVALDYWASKHLLYPIDGNEEHHPDKYQPLKEYLSQVRDMINAKGGICGMNANMDDSLIEIHRAKC
jgi:hypothetical protein